MTKQHINQFGGRRGKHVVLQALVEMIARLTGTKELFITPIPGLKFARHDVPTEPLSGIYEPCICLSAAPLSRARSIRDNNMLGEYDFSDGKLRDSVEILSLKSAA